jgi:hypothetical protein
MAAESRNSILAIIHTNVRRESAVMTDELAAKELLDRLAKEPPEPRKSHRKRDSR